MSQFDRDVAGLEDEGEDFYFAQTSPTKKSGTVPTDDEDDETGNDPSVEEELDKTEAGHFDDKAVEKKKKVEETEDAPKSDLDFIEEAAEVVEAERVLMFREDEEET